MLALLLALTLVQGIFDRPYAPPAAHGKHELDVFTPARRSGRLPVIVFIHGGGLSEGDRTEFRRFGMSLARQNYFVVIPSYRLYPSVTVRAAVDDVARALGWTQRHIAEYGGSPRRIILMGHSAGGYLSAILAFDPRYLQAAGVSPASIRGIFELSADYDNRDPDPGEKPADIAIDHHIYGETLEERDANSVYRYLHRVPTPFEATCESIDPGTQCVDRDRFVLHMRALGNRIRSFTEPNATHEALVARAAQRGDPLNAELRRFVRALTQ
ncbi:MAG: alpha/beta hydrolase [Candidatus Eremiobacteraeota bacterium]|nr:alpha/beta hydrolase [Candidatus Eremiobacteraeota bacterium]